MALHCGIVGLPNVGKSTIFNALTAAGAAAENYPFCTIEPNIGVVAVPDERLQKIAALFDPKKITPTSVEFVDIAGLVKGASKGEGLGNQFLGHIRSVDAITHVVRCFEDPDVVHVLGNQPRLARGVEGEAPAALPMEGATRAPLIDPLRDIEIIDTELALADLDTLTKAITKVEKKAKSGDGDATHLLTVYRKIEKGLNEGKVIRNLGLSPEEAAAINDLCFLTSKPVLYVANVGEKEILKPGSAVEILKGHAAKEGAVVVVLSGKIEAEISELSLEERTTFLQDLGLKESGLDQLAHAAYSLLHLVTYFTAGKDEVRAWTIRQGTKAPQAAGVIHSDFEKGFIRAECYHYNDLIALGSEAKLKEAGKMRLEGKEYVVQDGDVLFFRFNV